MYHLEQLQMHPFCDLLVHCQWLFNVAISSATLSLPWSIPFSAAWSLPLDELFYALLFINECIDKCNTGATLVQPQKHPYVKPQVQPLSTTSNAPFCVSLTRLLSASSGAAL